ncbi:MAG: hypothetical protein PHF66_02740 [Desulfobacteraceae bacterium]|nr:hypothetical protein [Desulfobacteraceae bacterium]
MGEIKSTLDLVMARTRHLTLSETEKRQQQREEGRKRLAGLIQQYEDGLLSPQRLVDAVNALESPYGIAGRDELGLAVTRRIDLDQDPQRWLAVISTVPGIDLTAWQEALEEYRRQRDDLNRRHGEAALERLAADGFTGSAVVPNLVADPDWRAALEALQATSRRRLEAALPGVAKV